ncbi:hypothetical protein M378DRAFT_165789 [Amanita muscaria Koide BX008]|uniref:Uncharacterized protein n=1 Tax=Amanita muscaria (strain Koide BX008) TaxID=946122 RepID=A0A0C2T755_AMAMK|nr:hypothetical protein M378DRAFT_165789 [Amanita muscaria Koide BX008]
MDGSWTLQTSWSSHVIHFLLYVPVLGVAPAHMANLIRSPKSGSNWTRNDLRAYNIVVVPETVATFFGNANLPPSTINPAIFAHAVYPAAGLPKDECLFFDFMEEAMMMPPGEETAVNDFVAHLLGLLGYDEPDRYIRTRKDIRLFICSANTCAKTDVCVISRTSRFPLLLVQEDKQSLEGKDPEPQLIAMAIAAFQSCNHRLSTAGLPTLNDAVIPGITMVGTAPTFYKVYITTALVYAVETGEYPAQATTVHKLIPPVQYPCDLQRHGMRPLSNRAIILSCFEAFKQFL